MNFAESIDTVQANLREVQPTILFGVPRIWEKVLAQVDIRLGSASPVKRATGRFWLRVADRIGDTLVRTGGTHTAATRLLYAVGWVFCYRALRERLGMRRVRYAASGAAPIAPDVLKFYMGIGIPMHEVYGMSENTAIATANRPGRVRLGTVGEPHPGVELKIDEATGEIMTRHRGTFAGYWGKPRATADVLDPDGWLHTGDVGEWVDGTHVRITDRMKDIIITAGGKNVAPQRDRERAQGVPVRQGGRRHRRPAPPTSSRSSASSRTRWGSGPGGGASRTPPTATCPRSPRRGRWCRASPTGSTPGSRGPSRSSASRSCPRSSTTRTAS
ncbi:AMP-binding protein [Nonomuraea ferruginea]